jgi:type VI secretion system FHA domain protein
MPHTRAGESVGRPSADWLTDVPAGAFANAHPSRLAGWNAPPGITQTAVDTHATVAEAEQSAVIDHSEHAEAVHAFVRLPESTQVLPSDWNEPPTARAAGDECNISVLRPPGQTMDHAGARQRLIAAFLDGAGLPGEALDDMNQEVAFREAGRMLRVAIEGTRKLLASASSLESELAAAARSAKTINHSTLVSSNDAASALQTLIGPPRPGSVSGSTAMSQGFADVTAHEMALVAAIGEVMSKITAELDPATIRARTDAKRRPFFTRSRRTRYWNAFETCCQALDNGSPVGRPLGEVTMHLFAQAYAQRLREI